MSKKKISTLLLLSPLLLAVLFLAFSFAVNSQDKIIVSSQLSENRKIEIETNLTTLLQETDPSKSIEELNTLSDDPSVAGTCHPLLHHIGKEAFKKYQTFATAMSYQDSFCNSGYSHGVIQQYFSDNLNVESKVTNTCKDETVAFTRWQCIHGIGHGVMYATGDAFDESLELCELLSNSTDIKTCANGVFMEQFIMTDHSGHLREMSHKNTDKSICTQQKKTYQATCLQYAPTAYLEKNKNDYTGAFSYCTDKDELLVVYCISGVGSQAMKEQINDPSKVATICAGAGQDNYIAACISGASSLYVYHHASAAKAYDVCENELKAYRTICEGSVWASANELDI